MSGVEPALVQAAVMVGCGDIAATVGVIGVVGVGGELFPDAVDGGFVALEGDTGKPVGGVVAASPTQPAGPVVGGLHVGGPGPTGQPAVDDLTAPIRPDRADPVDQLLVMNGGAVGFLGGAGQQVDLFATQLTVGHRLTQRRVLGDRHSRFARRFRSDRDVWLESWRFRARRSSPPSAATTDANTFASTASSRAR